MNIWNESNLKKPPLNTIANEKLTQDDLKNLKTILKDAIVFYENQTEFEQSAALCSRLIARRKNSFKKMYGFKALIKLNSALCRLLKIDIKSNLKNFLGIMPEFVSSNITKNLVPTKTNFEYLLLKLIALQKLYERISLCAQETAEYFTKLLFNNYFFDTLTLFLTTVSHLWNISNQIGIFTTDLYTKISIHRKDFPLGKKNNLNNEEFVFTKQLKFFLATNYLKKLGETDRDTILELEENTTNIKMVLNDVETQKCTEERKDEQFTTNFSDIEMVISKNPKNNLNINKIKTTEEIRKFIKEENKERKRNMKKCLTKKISENHWKKSIKEILNKINSNDKNVIKTFKYLIKNKV